ncbi:het domain protein pin-c2 [Diplodia corticola]|uniref:Het domain protein pin-c2 n=1 Tax=Diplodia corticola TaxID=236234 RepID=A0A1J9RY78_9PEZI|nr:het domain protein pin-c2 [Diplodia corticola]OJD33303.1 het domain protein pin-c2 [Diplodia corticola]
MSDMSKTFQDAVHMARKLGFRYLWIDSLCIIQDDPQDWEREAAQMCRVYSHAAFNIAAAHAPNGLVGCFVQRDGLLNLPLSVKLTEQKTALFTLYDLTKKIPGRNVLAQKSGAELGPPLFGRAWVFQEQMLSRRMLTFNGSEMSWKCLCGNGTERYPVGRVIRHGGSHEFIQRGITKDGEYFNDDDIARRKQHLDWCNAVMDYTHRGMTVVTDRLIAISGVADAIQQKTKNTFLVGLWKSELWLGLLWSIPHAREYAPTTSHAFDYNAKSLRNLEENVAPTWSWVSVTGPVVYSTATGDVRVKRICFIDHVEVSGPPVRKSGVLGIRGHTRTVYINSIYPYALGNDPDCPTDMTFPLPDDGHQDFEYKGRRFHPNAYFIFSDQCPTHPDKANWQLMRGMWRPDEVVPPDTPITFLAIAQRNHGRTATHDREDDPLQVFTIGLIPSPESADTYRRVGYAVWDDCAWYGYNCSSGTRFTQSEEDSNPMKQRSMPRKIIEKALPCVFHPPSQPPSQPAGPIEEAYPSVDDGFHDHEFEEGRLPELSSYHDRVHARTRSLRVV